MVSFLEALLIYRKVDRGRFYHVVGQYWSLQEGAEAEWTACAPKIVPSP